MFGQLKFRSSKLDCSMLCSYLPVEHSDLLDVPEEAL